LVASTETFQKNLALNLKHGITHPFMINYLIPILAPQKEKGGTIQMKNDFNIIVRSKKYQKNRVFHKVALSSPCLWASFHPPYPLFV
jgi:hypothetical protein